MKRKHQKKMEKFIWSWWSWIWNNHKNNKKNEDNDNNHIMDMILESEKLSKTGTNFLLHLSQYSNNKNITDPSINNNYDIINYNNNNNNNNSNNNNNNINDNSNSNYSTIKLNNHQYNSSMLILEGTNENNETDYLDYNDDIFFNNSYNNNNNNTKLNFSNNFTNTETEFNRTMFLFNASSSSEFDLKDEYFLNIIQNCTKNDSSCCNLNLNYSLLKYFEENISNCTTTTATTTSNEQEFKDTLELMTLLGTAIALGIIILATIIGNVFVIAAILLEKNLRSVANYLILSLAVADLLVACLVMPLSAVYEISKEWTLGPELCDMWTSCDVLCCTASILHLVAIALDRYWAVTNVDYIHHRTTKRVGLMILIIWGLSFLVSIAPLLGWKDPKWHERISVQLKCMVSQDISYQVFATASSFYVPLFVILILYWRIFQTARKRIRRRQQATINQKNVGLIPSASGGTGAALAATLAVHTAIGRPLPTISETTTNFTNLSSAHTSPEKGSYGPEKLSNGADKIENDLPTADLSTGTGPPSISYPRSKFQRKKTQTSVDSKRERKAAKTLAIITGAFVCCWAPFFVIAILVPICLQCQISPLAMSLSLWLGYFNSTLNPIIYTIFSPEFRNAFKRILCGRRNSLRRRRVLH